MRFPALSRNESISRSAAAGFAAQTDPAASDIAAVHDDHGQRNGQRGRRPKPQMHVPVQIMIDQRDHRECGRRADGGQRDITRNQEDDEKNHQTHQRDLIV